jgi:hypothetical protein
MVKQQWRNDSIIRVLKLEDYSIKPAIREPNMNKHPENTFLEVTSVKTSFCIP